jgi:hypothetical protein
METKKVVIDMSDADRLSLYKFRDNPNLPNVVYSNAWERVREVRTVVGTLWNVWFISDTDEAVFQNGTGQFWRACRRQRCRHAPWGTHRRTEWSEWLVTTLCGRPKRKKSIHKCPRCMFRYDRIRDRQCGGVRELHLTCFQSPMVALMILLKWLPKDIAYMIMHQVYGLRVKRVLLTERE